MRPIVVALLTIAVGSCFAACGSDGPEAAIPDEFFDAKVTPKLGEKDMTVDELVNLVSKGSINDCGNDWYEYYDAMGNHEAYGMECVYTFDRGSVSGSLEITIKFRWYPKTNKATVSADGVGVLGGMRDPFPKPIPLISVLTIADRAAKDAEDENQG